MRIGQFIITKDQAGSSPRVVTEADGIPILEADHARIHQGEAFELTHEFSALASSASAYLLFTPTKAMHVRNFSLKADGAPLKVELYSAPTKTGAGTPLTPVNRNQYSSNTSEAAPEWAPTLSADGDFLTSDKEFAASATAKAGEISGPTVEWILKAGTLYAIKVTNQDVSSIDGHLRVFWYEPTIAPP